MTYGAGPQAKVCPIAGRVSSHWWADDDPSYGTAAGPFPFSAQISLNQPRIG